MTLATVVNVERLLRDYLIAHADITALSPVPRIVGYTPEDKSTWWVRITELSAPQVNQPDHLVESLVQFDCYAGASGSATGGQPGVNNLYLTVRAVLGSLPGAHTLGTVTGVQMLGGPRELDTDLEPARDRRILTAYIWTHA